MTTWFTSDLHFGHNNIITYCKRPYADKNEMDGGLITNWNKKIQPTDSVYVLGDFSFHKENKTREIILRLNGIKHMILGNHDRGYGKDVNLWYEYFVSVEDYARVTVDGHKFVLCHFPFASWERGYVNLHGHTHGMRTPYFAQHDVGVDYNNMVPITSHEAYARAMSHQTKTEYA